MRPEEPFTHQGRTCYRRPWAHMNRTAYRDPLTRKRWYSKRTVGRGPEIIDGEVVSESGRIVPPYEVAQRAKQASDAAYRWLGQQIKTADEEGFNTLEQADWVLEELEVAVADLRRMLDARLDPLGKRERIRKLRAKADSTTFPAEEASLRAKADALEAEQLKAEEQT